MSLMTEPFDFDRPKFKVGDWVKVCLSPECPLPLHKPTPTNLVEHYPEQNGMTGEIIAIHRPSSSKGHPYLVRLPPIDHECCSSGSGFFAAVELEPLAV
ncbi:MAG: hypothetical protein JWQ89_4569 [Devosia sp.]|nr:hypothetical protein [Devosia sp.]